MDIHEIYGSWQLESAHELDAEGNIVKELYTPGPKGMLHYNSDGYVSAHLMTSDRQEPETVPPNQAYYGYTGRFEVKDGSVFHHVEIARDPNIIGKTLTRKAKLIDGKLLITWVRGEGTGRILWRRPALSK